MKSTTLRTIVLAALFFGLAAAASAQGHRCSTHGLAGAWAYTETGTVIAPTPSGPVAVVAAAVGRYDFDASGTFTGIQNSSAGGTVVEDMKLGTYTLNPDCTGLLTIQSYDPTGAVLRRTSVWAVVLADNATEMRAIMTSMVMPNGVSLSPIMTFTATRLFPGRGNNGR